MTDATTSNDLARGSPASLSYVGRVFRVRWSAEYGPYIAVGDTYQVGKAKKQCRVRERGGASGQQMKGWHRTMIGALDAEMVTLANTFCVLFRRGKAHPWVFASIVAELTRLKAKLERHGVVPA